jgi:hypothetical protein
MGQRNRNPLADQKMNCPPSAKPRGSTFAAEIVSRRRARQRSCTRPSGHISQWHSAIPCRSALAGRVVYPGCGAGKAWQLKTKAWTYECASCGRETSVTAGTILHHSELQLTAWFWAAYLMGTHSIGISALQLQRQLAFGSYKTTWLICAKLRCSMRAPGRSLLAGLVEVIGVA